MTTQVSPTPEQWEWLQEQERERTRLYAASLARQEEVQHSAAKFMDAFSPERVRLEDKRDFFAAHAMAAFIHTTEQNGHDTAEQAYAFADAMMEARGEA
jgi:hypothetical protein